MDTAESQTSFASHRVPALGGCGARSYTLKKIDFQIFFFLREQEVKVLLFYISPDFILHLLYLLLLLHHKYAFSPILCV